jgi:hypothetical protein
VRLREEPNAPIMEAMDWTTPQVGEIKMDAEIGSYQEEDGERTPFAERDATEQDAE